MRLTGYDSLLFRQPVPLERLALVRASLGAVIAVWVVFGLHDRFYVEAAPLLYAPSGVVQLPQLGYAGFTMLEAVTVASALATAVGAGGRLSCVLLAVSFFLLNGYVARFGGLFNWNANTHLNFFTLALCLAQPTLRFSVDARRLARQPNAESEQAAQIASAVLGFMQIYVGLLYFMSFVGKFGAAGWSWFTSGLTPYFFVFLAESERGKYLASWPWIYRVFTLTGGFYELGFLLLLWTETTRRWIAVFGVFFHLGIWLVMDISFWHLWVLFPALFIFTPPAQARGQPLTLARLRQVFQSGPSPS
jgi:hypothetical protein